MSHRLFRATSSCENRSPYIELGAYNGTLRVAVCNEADVRAGSTNRMIDEPRATVRFALTSAPGVFRYTNPVLRPNGSGTLPRRRKSSRLPQEVTILQNGPPASAAPV